MNQNLSTCERCFNSFSCRAEDIINCECRTVTINPEVSNLLAENYKGCLCMECLSAIIEESEINE